MSEPSEKTQSHAADADAHTGVHRLSMLRKEWEKAASGRWSGMYTNWSRDTAQLLPAAEFRRPVETTSLRNATSTLDADRFR